MVPTTSTATQQATGHKRSATSILKSIVAPRSSAHKKSVSNVPGPSNPLNSYNPTAYGAPQLPPLQTHSLLPPLDPPQAPFAQGKKMHKKSLSSLSLASFTSKKESAPSSPVRGSFEVIGTMFDLVHNPNGRIPEPRSPGKGGEKKPNKAKSAIDFSILRQKPKNKKSFPDVKALFRDNKENQRPSPEALTPSTSAGSGFINEPSAVGGPGPALFSLPQNHSHQSQDSVASRPYSLYNYSPRATPVVTPRVTPRVTPQPSNSSLHNQVLPRKSTSSQGSGSSASAANMNDELRKYTPTAYTPLAQRNFFGQEPTLAPKPMAPPKQRPKSAYVPPSASMKSGFSVASPRRTSLEQRRSADKKRSQESQQVSPTGSLASGRSNGSAGLDLEGINVAYEALLDSRGVPEHIKQRMRGLDIRVKQEFICKEAQMEKSAEKSHSMTSSSSASSGIFGRRPHTSHSSKPEMRPKSSRGDDKAHEPSSPKKTRPRSRTFVGASKDKDNTSADIRGISVSPKKKSTDPPPTSAGGKDFRGKGSLFPPTTTQAVASSGPSSPTMMPTLAPEEWVEWLKEAGRLKHVGSKFFVEQDRDKGTTGSGESGMKDVDVSGLHKLRLVLRNERLRWVESFIRMDGMEAVWGVVERVLGVEWREEHEDLLLHEVLLCLKALCTASRALQKLEEMEATIFPRLIELLFDEEKKGPCEFNTRGIIISLLFTHLSTARLSARPERARRILSYLADKAPTEDKRPIEFIEAAHTSRPYRRWCREVLNVTKEVFWIFLHGSNVIALSPIPPPLNEPYQVTHFPAERPPVPAAPYVGGVEWEASSYIATHLDLLNGCIASLNTQEERNRVRIDLKNSGWEKVMGGSLRTCKEKLHGAVHEGLKTWVSASADDGWEVCDVRLGPRWEPPVVKEKRRRKKTTTTDDEAPKLNLGFSTEKRRGTQPDGAGGWLY